VQKAVIGDNGKSSYIAMGGGQAVDANHLVTEGAIIGFWQCYQQQLGLTSRCVEPTNSAT
jgi:anthranilate 1,2-dioxygenase large subunit